MDLTLTDNAVAKLRELLAEYGDDTRIRVYMHSPCRACG